MTGICISGREGDTGCRKWDPRKHKAKGFPTLKVSSPRQLLCGRVQMGSGQWRIRGQICQNRNEGRKEGKKHGREGRKKERRRKAVDYLIHFMS